MRCAAFILAVSLLILPASLRAAEEGSGSGPALAQPLPATAPAAAPAEETPGFQAVRPLSPAPAAEPATPVAPPVPQAPPVPVPAPAPPPVPPPAATPAAVQAPVEVLFLSAAGLAAVMLVLGALIAGWVGGLAARSFQARDEERRRAAAKSMLAAELDARRQAFEAVPVPPNAEAGVSFVSAVAALAEMDGAWRAAQGSLHLLGEKQAGHLSVHYGAVRYVANFVKGQSFASGLRMLQANRIGGHPCPDAATMREAHVELAAAFRGVDKIIQGLKG